MDEKKNVIQLYAAFGLALVLSLIPTVIAALVSLLIFLGVLIAAYNIRSGADEGSLKENHTTFVIRTTWIGSFYALITMTIGSFYMLSAIDNAPLMPCIDQFINMATNPALITPDVMTNTFQPCLDRYMEINMRTFVVSGIIIAGPVLLFFALRCIRGVKSAISGNHVTNDKSWL